MPRILSGTTLSEEHRRHASRRQKRQKQSKNVDSRFELAFATMTLSSFIKYNASFHDFFPWSKSRQDLDKGSRFAATVTPRLSSPGTSWPPSTSISPSDSYSGFIVDSIDTRKTGRAEPEPMSLELSSKRRRQIFSNMTAERYIEPLPTIMALPTTISARQGEEEDSWGHFIDVVEEEEKVVRHSRILSRGSSFDPRNKA